MEVFNAVDNLFSIICKRGLISCLFKSVPNSMKARIISLSLLFFIRAVSVLLQPYKYNTQMCILPLLDMVVNHPHNSD